MAVWLLVCAVSNLKAEMDGSLVADARDEHEIDCLSVNHLR